MEKVNSFSVTVEADVDTPTIIHYDPSNKATFEATLGDWQAEGLTKACTRLNSVVTQKQIYFGIIPHNLSMNRVAYCAILKNQSTDKGDCILVCKKIVLNFINSRGVGFTLSGSFVIGLVAGMLCSSGIGLAYFAIAGCAKTAVDFYMVENTHAKVLEQQKRLLEDRLKEEMQKLLQN
mmetsp:Transcript_31556/g.34489  ORF Transcript_31556/g.34489 Transcript_31556/m.34489 type:complete len:178 (+) Transcript_31556:56-589(+)